MDIGKLTNEKLSELVLDPISTQRSDVIIGASIGEDCAALDFGDSVCVLTTDPITGTSKEVGRLAVNVSLNDIASSGSVPKAILLTLLCPPETTDEEIAEIIRDAQRTANAADVAIIGGHTERTGAVNRIVVSVTAVGKTTRDGLVRTGGASDGDFIYMTKFAGIEGTGIIANEKEDELKAFMKHAEIEEAKGLLNLTSVIEEGRIGSRCGVSAMHDVTEGGVLGAVYEMCSASSLGCEIYKSRIAVHPLTEKICNRYILDPLKLISSGSMLLAISPERAVSLETSFLSAGIEYAKIGTMKADEPMSLVFGEIEIEEVRETILSPESDELYKIIE